MAQKQPYREFRRLLRWAMRGKTQAAFAKESGITTVHLNRMLNMDVIAKPTKDTLEKIASAAEGVTLAELLVACGYSLGERTAIQERAALPLADREKKNAKELQSMLEMNTGGKSFQNLEAFMEALNDGCIEELSFAYAEGKTWTGPDRSGAEKYLYVTATWEDSMYSNDTDFILYYAETTGGKIVAFSYAMTVRELTDVIGHLPHYLELEVDTGSMSEEDALKKPYYTTSTIKRPRRNPTKENLLDIIFGTDPKDDRKYPSTMEGFGFCIDGNNRPMDIRNFLIRHKDAFCAPDRPDDNHIAAVIEDLRMQEAEKRSEALRKIQEEGAEPEDVLSFMAEKDDPTSGPFKAIAFVMKQETGIYFEYCYDDSYEWNRPCIIYDTTAKLPGIVPTGSALRQVVMKYALELGIKQFGRVMFTTDIPNIENVQYKLTGNIYQKVQISHKKMGTDVKQSLPEKSGLYRVTLSDGTKRAAMFDAAERRWVNQDGELKDVTAWEER